MQRSTVGLVVIGRNEGQRLHQCLLSVIKKVESIVYVDSGSTDGSIEMARSSGVEVVELDLSIPFTAARARNEGVTCLLQINPQIEFIQFVDGDCEVAGQWLEKAHTVISQQSEVAVVCGRRRERYPEQSVYNLLCDLEWDTPVGETKECGGDSMMRVSAFQQVGGFNPSLIAGEEPELCLRLRQQGWKILRIDAEMTLHDAQITRFSQWWRRALRSGYAYAEGFWLHGKTDERYCFKETKSIWLWGAIVPTSVLTLFWLSNGWSLLLLLAYPSIGWKIYRYFHQSRGFTTKNSWLYAISCMLIKFPQLQGQIQFLIGKLLGRQNKLIEYKYPDANLDSVK